MLRLSLTPRAALGAILGAALLYGCASSRPEASEEPVPSSNLLLGMAGRPLVVLPAQYLATAGQSGSWDISTDNAGLLPLPDEEIADALRKRGVRNWTYGREITASAVRNAGLAGDPRQLAVAGIRRAKAGDTPLPEPLASQIRGLVALTSARFAVLPLETRVDTRGDERKGSLRVLLIDARTARILWAEDIAAESLRDPAIVREVMSPYGFRLLSRDLASRFADMVVPQ